MPPVETVRPNGEKIRKLRTQRGLSTRQLGAMIGRHEKSVSRLEFNRDALASRVFMYQLARALQVDLSEIVQPDGDTEDEPDGQAAA